MSGVRRCPFARTIPSLCVSGLLTQRVLSVSDSNVNEKELLDEKMLVFCLIIFLHVTPSQSKQMPVISPFLSRASPADRTI